MLRKLIAPVVASLLASTAVFASNLPLQTFWDPTNALGVINALVQAINGGVSGVLFSLSAPVTTTGTGANLITTVTLPANSMPVGDTLHIRAYGVNSADANAKTVTFAFGNISCAAVVTASGVSWTADLWVTTTAAATETSMCTGVQGVTPLAITEATNGAVAINAAIAVTVSGTAATSGTMTFNEIVYDMMR